MSFAVKRFHQEILSNALHVVLLVFFVLTWTNPSHAQVRSGEYPFTTRSQVIGQHGMAASSQPLVSLTAIEILKKGGNAIDAAIAANALNGVIEPMMNGIGGDLFAIVWSADEQKLYGLNGSGRSPRSLTRDIFEQKGLDKIPAMGPLSISVPGCIDAWFALQDRFGVLPMEELLQPAIRYAREGVPIPEQISFVWSLMPDEVKKQPGMNEVFLINGKTPEKGQLFHNPALANTLEKIAKKGRDIFYQGSIARKLAEYVQRGGGYLSEEDLAAHKSEWVEPVSVNYRGYDVWELPPNGQGISVLQMLQILEGFDIAEMEYDDPEYLHLFLEAKKLAFEDRAKFYADPDFNDLPVQELLSEEYATKRRALIDPDRAASHYEPGNLPIDLGETAYFTVADREGNMISLIQSNAGMFGSTVTPPELGFALQNRGSQFTLERGHYNEYAPGKRPFHTIIPVFVTKDGRPWLSFGLVGGSFQPQVQVQYLINLIDFGMNSQQAIDAPRIVHNGSSTPDGEKMHESGGWVEVDPRLPKSTLDTLRQKGHEVQQGNFFGLLQSILVDRKNGVYLGASDPRTDGTAIGY